MAEPSLDDALVEELRAAVREGLAAQLALTSELVSCPSTRGSERAAQDVVLDALAQRRYAMDRWQLDPNAIATHPGAGVVDVDYAQASNVVATHRPDGVTEATGRSLILQGHVDVVPAGPLDMWRHPPFEPVIVDGWLHGRGAGDMKAGLVAAIAALDALARIGRQPASLVHIQSVVEEESTGNGAIACHQRGYRADAALIPEPFGERLIRANLGVLWFEVTIRGRPAHVAEATTGANAIVAAQRVIQALKDVELLWNGARRLDPQFRGHEHPINIQVGRIAGGDWASSVPAWCRLDCRAAFYPSMRPEDALKEIEAVIAAAAARTPFLKENPPAVRCNGFRAQGYVLEPGSDAEAALQAAHRTATGTKLATTVATAYLDARAFALYDHVPALVYGPVARNIHGFDEAVEIASLERVTLAIALFIAGWCGLERARG